MLRLDRELLSVCRNLICCCCGEAVFGVEAGAGGLPVAEMGPKVSGGSCLMLVIICVGLCGSCLGIT